MNTSPRITSRRFKFFPSEMFWFPVSLAAVRRVSAMLDLINLLNDDESLVDNVELGFTFEDCPERDFHVRVNNVQGLHGELPTHMRRRRVATNITLPFPLPSRSNIPNTIRPPRRTQLPFSLERQRSAQSRLEHNTLRYRYTNVRTGPDAEVDECSICVATLKDNDEVRRLPCLHLFHLICIDKWLRRNENCPFCRANVENAAAIGASTGSDSDMEPTVERIIDVRPAARARVIDIRPTDEMPFVADGRRVVDVRSATGRRRVGSIVGGAAGPSTGT